MTNGGTAVCQLIILLTNVTSSDLSVTERHVVDILLPIGQCHSWHHIHMCATTTAVCGTVDIPGSILPSVVSEPRTMENNTSTLALWQLFCKDWLLLVTCTHSRMYSAHICECMQAQRSLMQRPIYPLFERVKPFVDW